MHNIDEIKKAIKNKFKIVKYLKWMNVKKSQKKMIINHLWLFKKNLIMKIAIYFDNDQLQGGAFNYALTIIRILENEKFKNHEFILITDSKKNFDFLNNTNFKVYF